MIRNLKVNLKTLDGTGDLTIINSEGQESTKAVADIIVDSLCSESPRESGLTGMQKYANFLLAEKISKSTSEGVELSEDDVKAIRESVGPKWPPIIVGQIFRLLESK